MNVSSRRVSRILLRLAVAASIGLAAASPSAAAAPVEYEVFAVRFGVIPQFAVADLVAGADKEKKLDYLNLTLRAPIAETLDAASNLRAQDRMRGFTERSQIIVPGHDPEVFTRFKPVAEGVVEMVGKR